MQRKYRAVFLDRDGVINKAKVVGNKPYPPATVEALEILPGVEQATRLLHEAGWKLIVVTNQPDVARGKVSISDVEKINRSLYETLPLDEIRTCFHDDMDNCACRKPKPGLILAAAFELRIDLSNSFMVGDRWRDIEAGRSAGCKTCFIDYRYDEQLRSTPDYRVNSLLDLTQIILGEKDV